MDQSTLPKKTVFSQKAVWIGIGAVSLLIVLGAYLAGTKTGQASDVQNPTSNSQVQFSKTINRNFTFPIDDSTGNQIAEFGYSIQSLALQNQIIIKGQPANAVPGRTFLILTVKITNSTNQTMQINSRDYVRFSFDSSSELFAPSIHNDPISVQPISTEYTRLAVPIDTSVKKVVLHIGQITGKKTLISVSL